MLIYVDIYAIYFILFLYLKVFSKFLFPFRWHLIPNGNGIIHVLCYLIISIECKSKRKTGKIYNKHRRRLLFAEIFAFINLTTKRRLFLVRVAEPEIIWFDKLYVLSILNTHFAPQTIAAHGSLSFGWAITYSITFRISKH